MKRSTLVVFAMLAVILFHIQGSFGKKRKKVVKQDKEEDITDILTSEGQEGRHKKVLKEINEHHEKEQSFMTKKETKQDKFHDDSRSFEKKKKVVKQDQEDDITDILTSEGQEGWHKKVEKEIKEHHEKKKKEKETKQDKLYDDSPPTEAINSLETSLDNMEAAADNDNKGWTARAKSGLRQLQTDWLQTPPARRGEIAGALNAAAGKIEKFANAGSDPVGAIRGAIEIIATFANIAGPHGQIIGVALNFISGFLSLFGKGTTPKPVGDIVREEIEKWYSRDLSNQAEGAIFSFQKSKAFLNGVAKSGNQLTDSETTSLSVHVPVYDQVAFMGTLATEIRNIIRDNTIADAKKCLKYIRLYIRMAILKDVILQQMAALISDSQANIRNGVYEFQSSLRRGAKNLFKFLYESEIGSNILPYFDPDEYELTDAYLSEVLEIDNYDRSLAGTYFINVRVGGSYGRFGYETAVPLIAGSDRAATITDGGNFYWKLVPHGNNLVSIVNKYDSDCPDGDLCGALLTRTDSHGKSYATIKNDDPALWELVASGGRYRMKCKKGCNTEPAHEMCDAELTYERLFVEDYPINIATLTKSGGKTWGLRKKS